jgi:hypothetical protein
VKLLIIVLAPKWHIILLGYFSVVPNALFQVFTEISQHDIITRLPIVMTVARQGPVLENALRL